MKTYAAAKHLFFVPVMIAVVIGHIITAYAQPGGTLYVRGDFNGWGLTDQMNDEGVNHDVIAGDGVYTAHFTITSAGRYEFKVANDDWTLSYPASGNSWLETTSADQAVYIIFDTNVYSDEWFPETDIIGVGGPGPYWTAVGDWQGWNNADPGSAMTYADTDTFELIVSIATPGMYQYKAVKTGSWDAIGADGRSVNADTVSFETTEPDQTVTFTVQAFWGRICVDVESMPPPPAIDNDIWWDGLGHNSRDDLYRAPAGAVTIGTPVIIRFRTYHNDVEDLTLRVWNAATVSESLYPMEIVATTEDPPYGYDYWQAVIPAQNELGSMWYRFIVEDGTAMDYYEDDDLLDGGWGLAYEDSPDFNYQINVYDPDFETPDWIKNAVVYQIFPDRFYNGDEKKDPQSSDPTIYGNPVLFKSWDELPEGHCRAYTGVTCDEVPLGRDFFGGDLQGVKDKLTYLADLGITALYLSPIFKGPSNHLYDTTDYYRIDSCLGSMGTYQSLVNRARQMNIHVILDGVFNHTSSDSIYFDRYSRYHDVGAYESQASPYHDWYTFYDWPDRYGFWWGFDSLPVLTEIQEVRDYIFGFDDSVARWWIEHGAAGWRLDAAPDKSHEFWRGFRPRVKSANPDAVIMGEIWSDASPWILGDQFDSSVNYRFRRAVIGFINGDTNDPNQGYVQGLNPEQFDSVLQSIKEDYPPPAYEATMNLVGSHDTQRILWALTPGARNRDEKEYDSSNLAEGMEKLKFMAIIQMTLPGAPTVYYGDEAGATGDTDPDNRRPFPWDAIDTGLLDHYRKLIGARNSYSCLRTGSFDCFHTDNDDGTYVYGRKDSSGAAVVAVNNDVAAHDLIIQLDHFIPEGTVLTDALNGDTYALTDDCITMNVAGRWGAILITPPGIDLSPPPPSAGLVASSGDSHVDLAWEGVSEATGYFIYRSPVTCGGYIRLNDEPIPDTTFTDDSVVNGCTYYYVVTAVDDAGNESDRSIEAEAVPNVTAGL